ncbi:MAG TPA: hypothetical protein VK176_16515 [Phycisphaerales bacterium]|nr:hypothetical protein [Phycisphaerales bacterium]
MSHRIHAAATIAFLAGSALCAHAQVARNPGQGGALGGFTDDASRSIEPPPSEQVAVTVDSGMVIADPRLGDSQVVFVTMIHVTDAPWIRLAFDEALLSGDPANDNASRLKITSALDGGTQWLTSENVAQWMNTSAFFNGDTVIIELIASPGTGENRLVMSTVTAGLAPIGTRTICGSTDDRILSFDDRNARHSVGCTSWLINDLNSTFLTAGHCGTAGGQVMSFKVPLSSSSGSLVNPGPEHQYVVDAASVQGQNNGVGQDWGYFGVAVNSNTGLTPYQAYGLRHTLATSIPGITGSNIRITGYGTTSSPVSNTWNQVQKTHVGPMRANSGTSVGYHTDTTGGNSGSVVIYDNQGVAIGIHTHGGCSTSTSSYNNGTKITYAPLQAALAAPKGVCASGSGVAAGDLFISGDAANNFGIASTTTGSFAKVSDIPGITQGMAWDWNRNLFYVIDGTRKLYTMTRTGTRQLLGTVAGLSGTINALAFDPVSRTLYGVNASGGQFYRIELETLFATPFGSPSGGNVGGLDFDTQTSTLLGISDVTLGGSRLVSINTTTGAQTVIGTLGSGIADCNGLAYVAATNELYTINASTEQLLRVNRTTGAATVVGATGGIFASAYGMAGASPKPCVSDYDGTGFTDLEDYNAFVQAFESGIIDADIDGSGFVDFEDFTKFVLAFEQGC